MDGTNKRTFSAKGHKELRRSLEHFLRKNDLRKQWYAHIKGEDE